MEQINDWCSLTKEVHGVYSCWRHADTNDDNSIYCTLILFLYIIKFLRVHPFSSAVINDISGCIDFRPFLYITLKYKIIRHTFAAFLSLNHDNRLPVSYFSPWTLYFRNASSGEMLLVLSPCQRTISQRKQKTHVGNQILISPNDLKEHPTYHCYNTTVTLQNNAFSSSRELGETKLNLLYKVNPHKSLKKQFAYNCVENMLYQVQFF